MTILDSVRKGIEFIEEHLTCDIGVADVANAVNYSQFYFSREFARHTHISIYDYIVRRKVSESYQQLFRSKPRIIDLACMVGFQSHEGYTRAFRKVFGENPSEAAVYKPFAVFEPIDGSYLDFLCGLKIDRTQAPAAGCWFVPQEVAELGGEGCCLVLLSQETLLESKGVLRGVLKHTEPDCLAFRLDHLTRVMRVHHGNAALSMRCFLEHGYDPSVVSSNYILITSQDNCTDFLVPTGS